MIAKGIKHLIEEAMDQIVTVPVQDAIAVLGQDNIQFIDIRDVRELWRDGTIPGAYHAPRGMLEFWVDPDSPYHKNIFASDKEFIFFCAAGSRSALATKMVQDMGLGKVSHIEGGFATWRDQGGAIVEVDQK